MFFPVPPRGTVKIVSLCLVKTEYVISSNTPQKLPIFDDKMSGPDDKAVLLRNSLLRKVKKKKCCICIRFYMKAMKVIFFSDVKSLAVLKMHTAMNE